MTIDLLERETAPAEWLRELSSDRLPAVDGLTPVAGFRREGRSPEEVAAVEKAAQYGAVAVFFEAGRSGRAPVAQAFVFVSDPGSDDDFAELHKRLWSWGGVPLVYRKVGATVQLFRCAHDPDFMTDDGRVVCKPFRTLRIASRVASHDAWWDASRLRNGTLWDDPKACRLMLSAQKAAHRKLVEAVRSLNAELISQSILPVRLRRRLLILSLLIAYLEERDVLRPDFFGDFLGGATRFFEVLGQAPALIAMLKELESRFNGNVFAITAAEEAALLASSDLERFARLVEGYEAPGGQLSFWRLYSFRDLPVELISHIYQLFVTDADSSVYTPPMLVRLMLDEALSWDRIERLLASDQVILDPACGSGVFLVEAYKRLVLYWRSRNQWAKPGVDELRNLLARVHGIDLEQGAVELAAFSLCLALCDALEPAEIRASVKLFPKLAGNTLHHSCFFQAKEDRLVNAPVGVILANPPFESAMTTPAAERSYDSYQAAHGLLADKQLAYLFQHEAFSMLEPGGLLSMVQPSGFLYNQLAGAFRSHIFATWNVREVLDFVSVRGLFKKGNADPKIVIVVAEAVRPDPSRKLLHAVFRRSGRASAEQGFDIDYYDMHWLSRSAIDRCADIWRANLLGGTRVYSFVSRLRGYRTLGDHAASQGWDYGEGFIAGQKGIDRPAEHLIGKPLLPTSALSADGIDENAITRVTPQKIKDPKTARRFTAPMLLIKEHQDLFRGIREQGYLTYKDEIIGFAAPASDLAKLHQVKDWIDGNAQALQAYAAGISARLFNRRATSIASADVLAIPYPDDKTLDLSGNEEIISADIVAYMRDFIRLGSDAPAMKLDAEPALAKFVTTFVRQVVTVYPDKPFRALEAYRWPGIVCQPFVFGDGEVDWSGSSDLSGEIDALLRSQKGESLSVTRIARIYDGRFAFMLKPDRMRFWLPSIALRDADEMLADLRLQGF